MVDGPDDHQIYPDGVARGSMLVPQGTVQGHLAPIARPSVALPAALTISSDCRAVGDLHVSILPINTKISSASTEKVYVDCCETRHKPAKQSSGLEKSLITRKPTALDGSS